MLIGFVILLIVILLLVNVLLLEIIQWYRGTRSKI